MRKALCALVLAGLAAAAVAGCTPPERLARTTEVATPEQLHAEWQAISRMGLEKMDVKSATIVVHALAQYGPEHLEPILDVVASPDAEGAAKVLAVITLTPVLNAEMLPRLMEITGAGSDVTSRCCAVNLVGMYKAPEAEARLVELLEDPEHRVKTEAVLMLLMRGHAEGLARVLGIWDDPATTDKHRTQIALQAPEAAYVQLERIFLEAAANPDVETPARRRAVEMVGRHGADAAARDILSQCAGTDEDEDVRAVAAAGLEAVAARLGAEPAPGGGE